MATHKERVNRWRILRRMNPADAWSLIWSFEGECAARDMLDRLEAKVPRTWMHKLIDGGKEEVLVMEDWPRTPAA